MRNLDRVADDFALLDTQGEAYAGIGRCLAKGKSRFYVDKPAGSGKTRLSVAVMDGLSIGGHYPRTIAVAPTLEILNGYRRELKTSASHLFERGLVGEYHGNEKDPHQQIVLTTFPSLMLGNDRGIFTPDNTDLLILDEAHHALSDARLEASERFIDTMQFGLTASPHFGAEKTLDNTFHRAYRLAPRDGVRRGVTPPYKNFLVNDRRL